MEPKQYEQLIKDINGKVDGTRITEPEIIQAAKVVSGAVAWLAVICLAAIVTGGMINGGQLSGATLLLSQVVLGAACISSGVATVHHALNSLAQIETRRWLKRDLLEKAVANAEAEATLRRRLEIAETGVDAQELTPAQSMRILAVELEKAQAQGRHRDVAALNAQIQLLTHGVKGDATQAHIAKQESGQTAQEDTKH